MSLPCSLHAVQTRANIAYASTQEKEWLIRRFREGDRTQIAQMLADMRVLMSSLKSVKREPDLKTAARELDYYLQRKYPVFVSDSGDGIEGYLVCRVDEDVVWAESLYVKPDLRRRGIGSALYEMAEKMAGDLGSDTVYNWVHPNNEASIAFLAKRGYSVINLIEIRRPWKDEVTTTRIRVGDNEFDY
jgi:ribosomal protein S18 acetylase RimI-like enzyme